MNITFYIDYRTRWGESLFIKGDIPALLEPLRMEPFDNGAGWRIRLTLPDDCGDFTYSYVMRTDDGYERSEYGSGHRFSVGEGIRDYEIFDHWSDMPYEKPFYSVVFSDCVCRRQGNSLPVLPAPGFLMLSVDAPLVAPDCVVAVSGGCDALGNWDPEHAVVMSDAAYPCWKCSLPLTAIHPGVEYKFLILKKDSRKVVEWEDGGNRVLSVAPAQSGEALVVAGLRYFYKSRPWRAAGVAIPVFSLRTNDDFGVGEFLDLIPMIDWAASTGQRFIQVLPINDTTMTHTWTDSYPYNANSCFALHPMYLRLSELGHLSDPARQAYFDDLARELNALPQIDYERVNDAKNAFTRELFAEIGTEVVKSEEFMDFVDRNASWLRPYAAFCILRDLYHTPEFAAWGDFAVYDAAEVETFLKEHKAESDYVYWIQMNLDRQMRHVRRYAHTRGVALKGDIPIGISRTSVDAWISPRLFNLDCQAGAPPDDFSVLGQNWGFPTYNWDEMCRDGFAWWKARFTKMAEYFDVYRIDHVLGFFRIWQIPMCQIHGLLGIFNPALPFSIEELRSGYDFWIDPDRHTTPFIMEWFLRDFFGEYADEARSRFLIEAGDGRYRLRPEFATQRQVADYFATQPHDDRNKILCNALMGLIDDVLFIEDPYQPGKYHPRISGRSTYIYRSLSDYERWCFDRLYNDFFYHRHNDFWYGKAMQKLPPVIDATSMLTCAEDLGMIPDCVPAVMNALEILTLDIQRMPKDPRDEFGHPERYPYYSVCTTSTHDMGGIRQWWEENRQLTQRFYNTMLHEHGEAPSVAEPWICEKIVANNLASPAMLCILPLQDWLSIEGSLRRADATEEQINVPADSRHYWRYRMHLSIEDLNRASLFNKRVATLITDSGR